jgi:hypothetical protein
MKKGKQKEEISAPLSSSNAEELRIDELTKMVRILGNDMIRLKHNRLAKQSNPAPKPQSFPSRNQVPEDLSTHNMQTGRKDPRIVKYLPP